MNEPQFGDDRLPQRFWKKVRTGPNFLRDANGKRVHCWEWTASISDKGYGKFYFEGRTRRVHGVSYRALVGPVPDGLELDHLCTVKHCVNPAHLEPVTSDENSFRTRKIECLRGHPLVDGNLYYRKNGGRQCIECSRIHSRTAYDRRMEAYRCSA